MCPCSVYYLFLFYFFRARKTNGVGTWIQKPPSSGKFSCKSFHKFLAPSPPSFVYQFAALVPSSHPQVFSWLVFVCKIMIVENLRNMTINLDSISDCCRKEQVTISHLFLFFEFSHSISTDFLKLGGISWCCPNSFRREANSWSPNISTNVVYICNLKLLIG